MSAFRGFVLLGAAGAAVSTLGMRAAEQAAPQDPSAQYQLATQLYESARYREAHRRVRTGCPDRRRRVSSFARARAKYGRRCGSPNSRWRGARPTCSTSAEAADAEARTLLGDALWASGRFDEADAAYTEALDEGGSSRARFGLARSLASRTRLDEALDEARKPRLSRRRIPRFTRWSVSFTNGSTGSMRPRMRLNGTSCFFLRARRRKTTRWPRCFRARSGC